MNAEFYVMYIYCRVANISHKFWLAKVFKRPGHEFTVIERKGLLWLGNTRRHYLVWENRLNAAKLTMMTSVRPFYKLFTLFFQLFHHQEILTHRVHIFTRYETGSVYLPTQLERTLQLYW